MHRRANSCGFNIRSISRLIAEHVPRPRVDKTRGDRIAFSIITSIDTARSRRNIHPSVSFYFYHSTRASSNPPLSLSLGNVFLGLPLLLASAETLFECSVWCSLHWKSLPAINIGPASVKRKRSGESIARILHPASVSSRVRWKNYNQRARRCAFVETRYFFHACHPRHFPGDFDGSSRHDGRDRYEIFAAY